MLLIVLTKNVTYLHTACQYKVTYKLRINNQVT